MPHLRTRKSSPLALLGVCGGMQTLSSSTQLTLELSVSRIPASSPHALEYRETHENVGTEEFATLSTSIITQPQNDGLEEHTAAGYRA